VDMENELVSHPAVVEAAVTGVSHPKWEERPIALVVLRGEYKGKVTKEDIIALCKAKLAPYAVPKYVEFRDELPLSAVGKILKRQLRDEELAKFNGKK